MPRWLKLGLIIVGGFAAAIGLLIGLALYATSGVVEPVDRHLAALKAGDAAGAYAETSQAFRQNIAAEAFAARIAADPILSSIGEWNFGSRSLRNDTGRVSTTITSTSGAVQPALYRLVWEAESWKILAVEFTGRDK